MNIYSVELTDMFCGEANYSWVNRQSVTMPDLTHYGYDGGTNYVKANKAFERELMRKAKAAVGMTGVRGRRGRISDTLTFYPYGSCTALYISPRYA